MGLVPLKRVNVTIAWLAGQQKAHLCGASSARVIPENEIPPVIRGDIYLQGKFIFKNKPKKRQFLNCHKKEYSKKLKKMLKSNIKQPKKLKLN